MFGPKYKHIKRYTQIITAISKYGFGDVLERIGIKSPLVKEGAKHQSTFVRLRLLAEELGPSFVKLGQVLSNRPDILPELLIRELQHLQTEAAPIPFAQVIKTVETELGETINELFQSFSEKPVGSASIAQVHRATLKSGEVVAVKIQRPNIDKIVETDIEIISSLAGVLARHYRIFNDLEIDKVISELEKSLLMELDFIHEKENLKTLLQKF